MVSTRNIGHDKPDRWDINLNPEFTLSFEEIAELLSKGEWEEEYIERTTKMIIIRCLLPEEFEIINA